MNALERYLAVMHFASGVQTLLWEFGYWAASIERWYQEGLPRTPFSLPPGLPAGDTVFGDALPFPYYPGIARYRDFDVHKVFGFDEGTVRIPLCWRISPQFSETILDEDKATCVMINRDGVKVRVSKNNDSIPQFLAWPVHDRASWEQIKQERFGPDIMSRFPNNWDRLATTYQNRDYPLGVILSGFFSTPRELIGVEGQLLMYYDDPHLMHEINDHLANIQLAMLEEIFSKVDLDFVYIWEDLAYKNGPLISPLMFKEFLMPYYLRVTDYIRARGVDIICVDTDGDCRQLIPGFLEAGINGLYPFEVQAGIDIVKIRKEYPNLLIQGGLDKTKIAQGRRMIDHELDTKLPFMLSQGGYIPFCDHFVPPDVPWDNFCYYREKIRQSVENYQPA